jgi:AraC-like DNA-binding protein
VRQIPHRTDADQASSPLDAARDRNPGVLNVTVDGKRPGILVATDPGQPGLHIGGMELAPSEIIIGSDCAYHHRSSAACQWGAMSLAVADLAAAGQAITGRELTVLSPLSRVRPPPGALARLLRLHEAAGQLARNAPDILAQDEVARAIEQGLVHAMVTCMSEGEPAASRKVDRNHAAVMRRLEEALDINSDRTLYLAELCAAAGASARTLLACCQEHVGMGPIRYLWLRRMHLARRVLLAADPATTTVTEIATSYGFWELGRFSVTYREHFGETPSVSLRRPPADPRPGQWAGSPWQFAVSA